MVKPNTRSEYCTPKHFAKAEKAEPVVKPTEELQLSVAKDLQNNVLEKSVAELTGKTDNEVEDEINETDKVAPKTKS